MLSCGIATVRGGGLAATIRPSGANVSNFRPRSQNELEQLDDDSLIGYIVAARGAGELDAAKAGLAVLVFRRYPNVERRCRLKIPPRDAEDVAMNAIESAIKAAFAGTSVGEFVNWLNRIVSRRIADYHKPDRPDTQPLPEENPEDEGIWGESGKTGDPTGAVDVQSVVDQAYAELGDSHKLVVDLYVFEDRAGQEAADAVNEALPQLNPPMSDQNVQKVASRFRKQVRRLLEEADDGGDPQGNEER